MLSLTSTAMTISSGDPSAEKCVMVCALAVLDELEGDFGRPFTNRPPSLTTAVICTTSTLTFSAKSRPLVRPLVTTRPPPTSSATTRITCSLTSVPASHVHSARAGSMTLQTSRPSAKNWTRATSRTRARGSIAAFIGTLPVT